MDIKKTYKLFIGGQFPRTESGRYYQPQNKKGKTLGNICLSSRKDLRNAVVAAEKAFGGWATRPAYNRSQILYRMAEMVEGRKSQFIEELKLQDSTKKQAEKEIQLCIDRIIYYAGWCDKYQQIFSSVNPVASSHFNFSMCEPMGAVGIIAPQENSLIGLVSVMLPVIAGGNSCVVLASESKPLCAITFSEVLATSDLPGGVVNILTGYQNELMDWFSTHKSMNAWAYCEENNEAEKKIYTNAAENMKRVKTYPSTNWMDEKNQSPYFIKDFQEIKTTWHPIEKIGPAGSGY